ncbi:hypothetical protein H5P28_03105 [Ruficoccus amylovorans]|uniref:Glycoside hydrolase family 38 central domain-containing protein n=1 Tax=Ruficoccus amylovorans TaxID=1804625 RepID=A0A842HCY5_9BACT|nr:hypothetical protein [Ruficoccus amylovorans]MBC2593241.1 hypothetical protein [Ruficoccus amylovorans]
MKTVHLIFNAHLDPVWLWGWQDGVDEALSTCRSVCSLLEANPDVVFTRGESWVYEQIERLDQVLFTRIRALIKRGQWEPVGGWYIQPDCNLPSWRAFEKQIELGRTYFEQKLRAFPQIAYNVDSFGHAATLPTLMSRAGQSHYIMMRPQEHEMTLPARLFRWCDAATDCEVTTFRIAGEYCTPEGITKEFIERSLTELPDGVEHTMCFVGLGDHGGGPSQAMIEWCREHALAIPGARLVFSSPSRFFAAVAGQRELLPVVTGELQYHAVGCYSVMHDLKTAQKRTELRLEQAEQCAGLLPEEKAEVDVAWRQACFHAFHDTLGGTCIPSAYRHVRNEIGAAEATAERTMAYALRREVVRLAPDPLQRLVIYHPGPRDWSGWMEVEPWLEWTPWQSGWRVLDETGEPMPFQEIAAEAMHQRQTRLLFFLEIAAGEIRCLRLDRSVEGIPAVLPSAQGAPAFAWRAGALPGLSGRAGELTLNLLLREDLTDTWSHGADRYDGDILAQAHWEDPVALETGPLRWAWAQAGTLGERSTLRAEWRSYAGEESVVELILRVHWHEQRAVAKLEIGGSSILTALQAGIPGGELRREPVGREFPFADWVCVVPTAGEPWGVASPDVFAADARPERLALTLLRASVMAHHEPNPGTSPRREISDQGEHLFCFRFVLGGMMSGDTLASMARDYVQRPLVATTTDGMPRRYLRGEAGS